jgi:hypothetical protein
MKNGVLAFRNALTISRASLNEAAIGFWQMHGMRCRAQSNERGLCPPTSVMLSTKSGFNSIKSFSGSSYTAGRPNSRASSSARARVRL